MILFKFMRPRKRDFRGDTRKGAKNYGIVSSDDSEVYRRKDPFAGRNRKRPSGRRAQLNICNPSSRFGGSVLSAKPRPKEPERLFLL